MSITNRKFSTSFLDDSQFLVFKSDNQNNEFMYSGVSNKWGYQINHVVGGKNSNPGLGSANWLKVIKLKASHDDLSSHESHPGSLANNVSYVSNMANYIKQ